MKNKIISDKKKRKLFFQYELNYIQYKSLLANNYLSENRKWDFSLPPRNSNLTRCRNRCFLTGRGRAVFRFCKLSRIQLRIAASNGMVAGVEKASW